METEIKNELATAEPTNFITQVEQSRAVQEVQAALVIAKRFPRDRIAARARIMEECRRLSLAEQAVYSFPKGGKVVTGPSIRLAEMIASNWGNIEFGIRELERVPGCSKMQAFCWDKETNTRSVMDFDVPHEYKADGKVKKLTDSRDIYEYGANQGARRMRSRIEAIIPGDLFEVAVETCRETIKRGGGEILSDRISNMTLAFKQVGISQEMLEKHLGHKMDITTVEEIVELKALHKAIKDKDCTVEDIFGETKAAVETQNLRDKLKNVKPENKPTGFDEMPDHPVN